MSPLGMSVIFGTRTVVVLSDLGLVVIRVSDSGMIVNVIFGSGMLVNLVVSVSGVVTVNVSRESGVVEASRIIVDGICEPWTGIIMVSDWPDVYFGRKVVLTLSNS